MSQNKPQFLGSANNVQNYPNQNNTWIFDCGATDTMTFELSDITSTCKPKNSQIQTANGGVMPVKGAGTIEISPMLKLPKCL